MNLPWRRDRALRAAFVRLASSEEGPTVLAKLRDFCGSDVSTIRYDKRGSVDALATAKAIGRHEVWLMISFYLNLSENELVEIDRNYQREMARRAEQQEYVS